MGIVPGQIQGTTHPFLPIITISWHPKTERIKVLTILEELYHMACFVIGNPSLNQNSETQAFQNQYHLLPLSIKEHYDFLDALKTDQEAMNKLFNIMQKELIHESLSIEEKKLKTSWALEITKSFTQEEIDKFIKTPQEFDTPQFELYWQNIKLKKTELETTDQLLIGITLKIFDILSSLQTLYKGKEFFFEAAPKIKRLDIQYDPKLTKILLKNIYPFLTTLENTFNKKHIELFFDRLLEDTSIIHQYNDSNHIKCNVK
jgi:hypothetical protein